jgi:septal ring factor EnvC (AmiA/AmiB activator)
VNTRVNIDCREFCSMNKVFQRNEMWRSLGIGILLFGVSACSELESIVEPETSDLQLTVDTLRISLRDAQRSMAELRAEVDVRSQELADVQIIRAQLEGRVREAERQLTEARHVIELQREELADSRTERERVARTGAALQHQLKQLQKQLSKMGKQAAGGPAPAIMTSPAEGQPTSMLVGMEQEFMSDDSDSIHSRVLIKPGDTLWSIAHRHHTSVRHLMSVNALLNDRIQAGQTLWLTESAAGQSERE